MLIPMIDKLPDATARIRYRGEGAAANSALSDQPEPTLDLVEPGAVGGGVMNMKTLMSCKPAAHSGVFVSGVVVHDRMQIKLAGHRGIDMPQEAQEFLMSVARLPLSEHRAVGHIQRCEQGGGAMAVVLVSDALQISQTDRQDRLVRSSAWICLFPSTHSTRALSGGFAARRLPSPRFITDRQKP